MTPRCAHRFAGLAQERLESCRITILQRHSRDGVHRLRELAKGNQRDQVREHSPIGSFPVNLGIRSGRQARSLHHVRKRLHDVGDLGRHDVICVYASPAFSATAHTESPSTLKRETFEVQDFNACTDLFVAPGTMASFDTTLGR